MSRKPDFILKSLNRYTDHRTGKIGAAWQNEDGSLSLQLDIALIPDPNCVLTLFPNDGGETGKRPSLKRGPRAKKVAPMAPRMADLPVSFFRSCTE